MMIINYDIDGYNTVRIFFRQGGQSLIHVPKNGDILKAISAACEKYNWLPSDVSGFDILVDNETT